MKLHLWIICSFCLLSGCAYVDGVNNEKNVIPAPANTAPQTNTPSQTINNQSNTANINAGKLISPAIH